VEVRVTNHSKRGEFIHHGGKKIIPKTEFEDMKKTASAVFEMIPDQRSNDDEKKGRRGTAFSIGENLVLTNNHVLDESFRNQNDCSDFQVQNSSGETFDCKEVHFCSAQHDVCLIEMAPIIKTKRDCFMCAGTKYGVSLAQGPSLKLKATYSVDYQQSQDVVLTAIGNSGGHGIHLSRGRGITVVKDKTYFYAPITQGNSGGALLNAEGLVIGVVKLQSKILISSDPNSAYNIAAPTELVIRLIRESLVNDPETLEKFNRSVVQ
jgi:S1-C subfamily serine protease